jgi:hypothetical protein
MLEVYKEKLKPTSGGRLKKAGVGWEWIFF